MQTSEFTKSLLYSLSRLNRHQQYLLQEFIESLTKNNSVVKPDFRKFSGAINTDDLQVIKETIEEDCSKIVFVTL